MYELIANIEKKQQELQAAVNSIYIINAGQMNHGKSSLFNSILDKNVFKVADVRETKANQTESYMKDVYVIDTPGLGANKQDNDQAFAVYKKANFIVFVHNPTVGELHREEIEYLGMIANKLTPGYFWKHFAIILTFRDAFEDDGLQIVQNKILSSIYEQFKIKDIPIFTISNSRYEKGMNQENPQKRKVFLEKSGMLKLRHFIQQNIPIWRKENLYVQKSRFSSLQKEAIQYLEKEKLGIENKKKKRRADFEKKRSLISERFKDAKYNISAYNSQLEQEKRELDALNQQYRREHY